MELQSQRYQTKPFQRRISMSASTRIKNIWSIKKLFVYPIVISFIVFFASPISATEAYLAYLHVSKIAVYGSVAIVQFSENNLARCGGGWQLRIPNLTDAQNTGMYSILLAAKLTSTAVDVWYDNYNSNPSNIYQLANMIGCATN
jgi:hypothetical protein